MDFLMVLQIVMLAVLIWNGAMLFMQTLILRLLLPEIKKISGGASNAANLVRGIFGGKVDEKK